jgi:GTPase SAR1 family protein
MAAKKVVEPEGVSKKLVVVGNGRASLPLLIPFSIPNRIQLVVPGNSGVGKTALVLRYVQNTFNSECVLLPLLSRMTLLNPHLRYPATIGGAYLAKKVTVDDVPVNLQIWDTAGQERFRSMVC